MQSMLVELIANAMDVAVLTLLFCRRLPAKYNTYLPTVLFIIIGFSLESLPIVVEFKYYPIEVVLFSICLLYLLFFRQGTLPHKLFWLTTAFVVIFAIAFTIMPILSYIIGEDLSIILNQEDFSSRTLYLVIVNIIKFSIFFLMSYKPSKYLNNHLSILVCLFIPVVGIVFGTWIYKIYVQSVLTDLAEDIVLLLSISYLFISISSFTLYRVIVKDSERMAYLLAQESHYATVSDYTEQIKQTNHEIRVWQHDMKQHLSCLATLMDQKDYEGAGDYLESFTNHVQLSYLKINSGNYLADAILSAKVNIATSKGIKVECSASVPETLPIDDVDFCSVLSNIMDNAIEACELVKGKTYIECNIITIRNQLVIEVENSSTGIYKMSNGIFKSLKKSGIHGIGLRQTQHIIDKYEGICSINAMDNLFRIEISIPLENR